MEDSRGAHASKEIMQTVLDHYLKHHELVLRKLTLAQKATQISLQKIKDLSETQSDPEDIKRLWDEIIELFRDYGASESELFTIEDVLGSVPKSIKEPYQMLIEQDQKIRTLVSQIDFKKYENAKKVISKVQGKPNPMTGLTSDDYEEGTKESEAIKAFTFMPTVKRTS